MRWFVIILIVIPAIELFGMITMGRWIGGWQTLLLIVLTGILGAYIAKREGTKVLRDARQQLERGQAPTGSILDGICILLGGVLLILPGFITDIVGLLLILPLTRITAKAAILYFLHKRLAKGSIRFYRR